MGPCVELRSVLCRSSHSITVQAADPSGAFTTQTFTIAVTDQAPSTPTDSDGATGGSVSEGASNGATVGITAASTDVNGGTVTFSLTDKHTAQLDSPTTSEHRLILDSNELEL